VTIAVGLALRASGIELGAPLPPFVLNWGPRVHPAAAIAVLVATLAVVLAPALLTRPRRPAAFAAAACGLGLAVGLSIAAARNGTAGWYEVFDYGRSFEAKNEYLPALPAFSYGTRFFLDHFAELVPSLPVHSAGHPPGLLLVMHILGITTARQLAALCILATGALGPLTYAVARNRLPEERARIAALLTAFSPTAVLFGITSADALYAALGLVAAAGLLARGALARVAGAVAVAVASFFSWALIAVAGYAALTVWRTRGLRAALALSAACALAVSAFYATVFGVSGFDPIGAIRGAHQVYEAGIASTRPYAFWLFGSPVAFAVAAGLPIVYYAVRALAAAEPGALALAAIVVAAAVAGLTKAETERIWLFLVPLACLAAASVLPARRVRLVLGALAFQALATEVLFDTVW
jgi:methylthioxylose transferase